MSNQRQSESILSAPAGKASTTGAPGANPASMLPPMPTYDVQHIRKDFPILHGSVHGKPLVYLDNAATSQKPRVVIDRLTRYYAEENANIHRGVHLLSETATFQYERSRIKAKEFLNAKDGREIIFVRSTTEGINLVAASYGRQNLHAGDEIILTAMEHHSNIVPWQILCQQTGAVLRVVPINDRGELRLDTFEEFLGPKTKIVSVVHISNALGTINPVKRVIDLAHSVGAKVLLDGAQAVPHVAIDVQALDCDFYAFSGHKLYGPTGIGVLYGKAELLEAMPPYQGGGDMIRSVTFAKTTYNDLPNKFEAGTPNIAGVVGLGTAIDYVNSIGLQAIAAHENALLQYATPRVCEIPGVRLIGEAHEKASILSFVMDKAHPHDIGTILDREGIAIRTGHHCTQPLMDVLCVAATARASFGMYNTFEEVDALVKGIHRVTEVFH